ncbi:hypothetical protein Scep_015975 [Stephania cephalantha]|uniref:Metal-nicotianamine transporter YSL7 n=1 Tax=Stephania cephalantha TaxID=152367 RepID=A0AAP0IM07_9MAGN
MWPLIDAKKGDWYRADLDPQSLRGLQGYKVFIGIAMILGDGLYNFLRVFGPAIFNFIRRCQKVSSTRRSFADNNPSRVSSSISFDDARRTRLFLKDQIPIWLAALGYITLAVVSCITVPQIFSSLKWYHVLVLYVFAPVLAFCNAYGVGLTDFSLFTNYGLLAIFTIGAWAGANNGGVLAGLAACGVTMNVIATASDLMQDFKTGYLTLASPRSMFVSQVIGTAMGCVISPCVFWIFVKAFKGVGEIGSEYPAPYALAFRNIAILGVEGLSQLPQNCLKLCAGFFAAAILINAARDMLGKKAARFIPLPMAMAVPFYVGAYIGIDVFIGTAIMYVWGKVDKAKARAYGPAVASGMICGDGLWTLPASILALAGLRPPICMKFLSRETNARVDQFIAT